MQQPEIHYDGIEAGVRKGKLFSITFPKVDTGITSSRLLDHFGRKIDSDRPSASCRRRSCDVARTASNVEYSSAFGHARRVEQRRHSLYGDSRKTLVVP